MSQGDVIHCPRPSKGRRYQKFKDIYLGSVFTEESVREMTIGPPLQGEERTLENLNCPNDLTLQEILFYIFTYFIFSLKPTKPHCFYKTLNPN